MAAHHYAIDAAKLLEKCHLGLHSILDHLEAHSNGTSAFRRKAFQLIELNDALRCTERLIHTHLLDLLDREIELLSLYDHKENLQFFGQHLEFPSLMDTVATLHCAEKLARKYRKDGETRGSNSPKLPRSMSHQRVLSNPVCPTFNLGSFDIDDPIEDEESSGGGWYFGRSSPPPPVQLDDTLLNHKIVVNKTVSAPSTRHRRTVSHGALDSPIRANENAMFPSRSAKDSSLFRLIVTLQLCLVRIEEANTVLCKGKATSAPHQRDRGDSDADLNLIRTCTSSNSFDCDSVASNALQHAKTTEDKRWKRSTILTVSLGLGITYYYSAGRIRDMTTLERIQMIKTAGKASVGLLVARSIRSRWRSLCMNSRVSNSAEAIQDWIFSWICLVNENTAGVDKQLFMPEKYDSWYSIGSIRFQLIKRGMDLFYASIGKAIELTRGQQEKQESSVDMDPKSSGLWTYVVASLAASYYNVIGPSRKSAQVIRNASDAKSIIQNAWGVVSLPAVKKASLEATRILKGAAIAERIEIDGVFCFVLSKEPCPALTSALRRYRRQQQREDVRLGTIHEQFSSGHASVKVNGFVRRNVIFHLTGGGWYAHTIAGDLPYLLDWSAATNSVVIIPEYALLPQHKFPDAIAEVTMLYRALRCGQAATLLGFQANKIIVSGESAGGNLAAALCLTIIMDRDQSDYVQLTPSRSMDLFSDRNESFEEEEVQDVSGCDDAVPLPDALMMSCPALNLSLDLSPSRLVGAHDPVLPSGLITAISNSYLPPNGEFPKNYPIASPYFASDDSLSQFPPTLIFTSSEDPFLDDSVDFNARLRNNGVKSNLRAVHHMPHAFWALSTAGIPEARQVQKECMDWLSKMFIHR